MLTDLTDYKIVSLLQDDAGGVVRAVVRIYEGAITTAAEEQDGAVTSVTRYRRTTMLREVAIDGPLSREALHARLRGVLGQDRTRQPIVEQRP